MRVTRCGGLAQRTAHARPQGLWGLKSGNLPGDRRPQREAVIAEPHAARASGEVRLELDRIDLGELSVEVGVDLRLHLRVGHHQRAFSPAISASWRRLRARESRDMMVPTGTSTTSLISL